MVLEKPSSCYSTSLEISLSKIILQENKPIGIPALSGVDAGLHPLEHYEQNLPSWRFCFRQKILYFLRQEMLYLVWIQRKFRTPALDSYFAITANLGTHTCFMIFLPILFWCGYSSLGRGMVHILASGVFLTGIIKDMFSLPRPLSPPLHRISMSESAALEYGFPSTHSANAASVAVYLIFILNSSSHQLQGLWKFSAEILACFYAFSIILGRLYCGMHGFLDVIVGSMIGIVVSLVECIYGARVNKFLYESSWIAPVIVTLIVLILVQIHPDPADGCPCFNDTVAFAGVLIGIEAGGWHYANGKWSWDFPVAATVPFDLRQMGWKVACIRIIIGILLIFAWREITKRILSMCLPHLFRFIETNGLTISRKNYKQPSEYKSAPANMKIDSVIPTLSDVMDHIGFICYPIISHSVDFEPQSAADTNEIQTNGELHNREALDGIEYSPIESSLHSCEIKEHQTVIYSKADSDHSSVHLFDASEKFMELNHDKSESTSFNERSNESRESFAIIKDGIEEKKDFFRPQQSRIRYDVEVVTKLIVYAGIGWLSVELNPIFFEIIGLGIGTYDHASQFSQLGKQFKIIG